MGGASNVIYLRCAQGKHDTKGLGIRREARCRQEASEKQLCATPGNPCRRIRGRVAVGRISSSRNPEERGRTSWEVGMPGRRRDTLRWANDLVWRTEILGQRRETTGWVDEPPVLSMVDIGVTGRVKLKYITISGGV